MSLLVKSDWASWLELVACLLSLAQRLIRGVDVTYFLLRALRCLIVHLEPWNNAAFVNESALSVRTDWFWEQQRGRSLFDVYGRSVFHGWGWRWWWWWNATMSQILRVETKSGSTVFVKVASFVLANGMWATKNTNFITLFTNDVFLSLFKYSRIIMYLFLFTLPMFMFTWSI